MKKWKMSQVFALLAFLGWVSRRLVYAGAVDEKNLIVSGHPLLILLWVLTAAALALAAAVSRKPKEQAWKESGAAFLGHGLLGVGMALAVCLSASPMAGILGLLWKILGLVSPVCLLAAGFARMRGKRPYFALYIPVCLFFAVHVVAHYQLWCSNPQFTDYAFALLAAVALSLHCYQLAACQVGAGNEAMKTLTALTAVYCAGAELAASAYPALYFGALLFCLANLEE